MDVKLGAEAVDVKLGAEAAVEVVVNPKIVSIKPGVDAVTGAVTPIPPDTAPDILLLYSKVFDLSFTLC